MAVRSAEIRPANNLLRALRPKDYALLEPALQPWDGRPRGFLYDAADNMDTVYFPCGRSLVSLLAKTDRERAVETIHIGREGVVGGIASRGRLPAYARMVVHSSGPFLRLRASDLEAAALRSLPLRHLFARYADCLLAQMLQSIACNAIHPVEQRAAKWIVAAMDRTGDDMVALTQDQLAAMLGIGRSYASRVIRSFRTAGILATRRGGLQVRSRDALERRSCSCNDAVKAHFDAVLQGVYAPDPD
jgi:CRP-like cAMP-binding protein